MSMAIRMKITLCLSVWEFPQSVMFFIMSRNDSPSVKRYYVELIKVSLIFMACFCAIRNTVDDSQTMIFYEMKNKNGVFLICC